MNEIDLSSTSMDNVEISMRVSSGLQSGDTFYTDLNGFQVQERDINESNFFESVSGKFEPTTPA